MHHFTHVDVPPSTGVERTTNILCIKIPPTPYCPWSPDCPPQAQQVSSRKWYSQCFLGWKSLSLHYWKFSPKMSESICIFSDNDWNAWILMAEHEQHHHSLDVKGATSTQTNIFLYLPFQFPPFCVFLSFPWSAPFPTTPFYASMVHEGRVGPCRNGSTLAGLAASPCNPLHSTVDHRSLNLPAEYVHLYHLLELKLQYWHLMTCSEHDVPYITRRQELPLMQTLNLRPTCKYWPTKFQNEVTLY